MVDEIAETAEQLFPIEETVAIEETNAKELQTGELWEHSEVLELVLERKKRKFIRSGLLLMFIGVIVIALGHLLNSGANSIEGLIVGTGAIIELIGILRVLIGLIRPIVPSPM